MTELRAARQSAGVSQRALARELGISKSQLHRLEHESTLDISVLRLSAMAAVLGYEVSIGLHPAGDGIRDDAQQGVVGRLRAILAHGWRVTAEARFPNPGDPRSCDLLLRGHGQLIGVEVETRVRDIQELVRRMRGRETDGGTDVVLLVLSDSAHNRRLVGELREALGPDWVARPRSVLGALRRGQALAGSGVILI